MNTWTFTITRTRHNYHWIVHHNGRVHAQGTSGDYDTAWLDSHDAIPDEMIVFESVT